jgi:hypothetical protein
LASRAAVTLGTAFRALAASRFSCVRLGLVMAIENTRLSQSAKLFPLFHSLGCIRVSCVLTEERVFRMCRHAAVAVKTIAPETQSGPKAVKILTTSRKGTNFQAVQAVQVDRP